ncbi:MAG TPA: ABC transporter permease [Clostridia bacterium]|nr:ABC transporter permease [Clostridia bacterium]
MTQLIALLQAGIMFGTVILYGSTGETLAEKSGNLNLGVPGIMYLGGIMGLMSVFFYEMNNPEPNKLLCIVIAMSAAFFSAMLGGLIFSVLTISLRTNQIVTGLALTIFCGGFANFFGGSLNKLAGGVGQISVAATSSAFRASLPFAKDLPPLFGMLLGFGFMVYLAVAVALFVNWFINRTSVGLNLRAVGENPATADAAGINVTLYKYLATCIGAGISGLGGLFYVMDYTKGTWDADGGIERLGWLAVALVIFSSWNSKKGIWGAYLFGMLFWLFFYIPNLTRRSMELFKMLPYLVTIIVLIAVSLRRKRESQPPAALGLPYFREER